MGKGRSALARIQVTSLTPRVAGARSDAALTPELRRRVENHPCYSEAAHLTYARMHVPVAPACNVQCNYCNRKFDCANESRPGVTSTRLTPAEAARKVGAVLQRLPQLTVVGIAGPGDALAKPEVSFETLERVGSAHPQLKLCLATNGLALAAHVDTLRRLKVDHVTVTWNAVRPEVAAAIYQWVLDGKQKLTGFAAARHLLSAQLEGIAAVVEAGILCKVNSVLVPGINEEDILEINRGLAGRGVFIHNVMPLLSAPEYGTAFSKSGQRGPTSEEIDTVRSACAGSVRLMTHCRQCRADAIGLLGEDLGADFLAAGQDCEGAGERVHTASVAGPLRVAVATRDGRSVDCHFGHAESFAIFEIDDEGARPLGLRHAPAYCQGGFGEEEELEEVIAAIADCSHVLVAKMGRCPRERLARSGIVVMDDFAHEPVTSALELLYRLERHLISEAPCAGPHAAATGPAQSPRA